MGFLGSIADIANKLLPSQKRRDIKRLRELEMLYAKALTENRDTDAAIHKKEMTILREAMGYED